MGNCYVTSVRIADTDVSMAGISDDEIIAAFRDTDMPALVARDLAEEFDVSPQAINERLHRLHTGGHLETRKVGASARIWWLSDSEREE